MGKKTINEKIEDLLRGLETLKTANNDYLEKRKESYLDTLAIQIRALMTVDGTSRPLIIDLAKELGIDIDIYSYPECKEKNLTLRTIIGKTWSPIKKDGFKKYNLEEWMKIEIYVADRGKECLSRNALIKQYCNNYGPAHYSNDKKQLIETQKNIKISNCKNGLAGAFIDIGEATFWAGHKLILTYELEQIEKNNCIRREIKEEKIKILKDRLNKHELEFMKPNGSMNFIIETF